MRRTTISTLALAVLGACTHEKPMSSIGDVTGGELVVETTSHQRLDARAYPAEGGVQITTDDQVPIPPSEIDKITEIKRGRGALEGGGIGALAGIAVGAALGYASGDDPCETDRSGGEDCFLAFSAADKAMIFGILVGGLGGIGGLIVGAIVGSRDVYTMNDGTIVPRITPSGPPGSTVGMTVRW